MPTVADALRQHAPDYLNKFDERIPFRHRKILSLIMRCRTGQLGNVWQECERCQKVHWSGRSCGNRHCPNCQKQKTQNWLQSQTQKLLPVQHFVVTFTVPKELRPLLRGNQKDGYEAIFRAGSQTINTLLKKPKNLGSDRIGFFGALHTWGRDLKDYHPHVHFVVPGGGLSPDGKRWLQVKPDQLFHPLPATALYKKLFVEVLRKAGLYSKIPYGVLKLNWVVNIKPVGNGESVLKYLAPYVYRTAISDSRIVSIDDDGVTYRVKPTGKKRYVDRHLPGEQFVRSFAQHILPNSFQKIRYYGFMSPNCKVQLETVRWLVWMWKGWTYYLSSSLLQPEARKQHPTCSECRGKLKLMLITGERGQVLWSRSLPTRAPP